MASSEISIGANLVELRREMAKIPGIGEKEARRMVKDLDRQMKRAEKSAKKAAKGSSSAWSKTGQGLKGMLSEVIPGFSGLDSKIQGVGASAGLAAGPVGIAATALAALGASAVVAAVGAFKLANAASEYVDKVGQMAAGTGLTLEEVAGLGAAASALGTDFDKLKPGLSALVTKLAAFEQGSESAKEQFAGIADPMDHTTGMMKSTGQVLREVVMGLESIDDEGERARKRMALFGGEAAIVMASLEGGSATMLEYAERAEGMFSEEALASSAAMDEALAEIGFAVDRLVLVFGSELGPTIADVILAMASGAEVVLKYSSTITNLVGLVASTNNELGWLLQTLGWVDSGAQNATEAWEAFNREGSDVTATAEAIAAKLEKQQEAAKEAREAAEKLAKEQKEAAAAAKARASAEKAATKATRDQATADKEAEAALKKRMDGQLAWLNAWADDYFRVQDMTKEAVDATKSAEVLALNETQAKYEELGRIVKHRPDLAGEVSAAIVAIEGETAANIAEINAEAAANQAKALKDTQADLIGSTASTFAALADVLASHGEENKEAAMVAFRVSQAASIAEIAMFTAVAYMRAFAELPPPANAIAAGSYVALGAIQAGLVAAQAPPSFHAGGIVGAPDERMISARAGEGVLTPQGVRAVGGPAGVAAANQGAGGPMEITVIQRYQHRSFGAFIEKDLKMTTSPLRRAIHGDVRSGHRRG